MNGRDETAGTVRRRLDDSTRQMLAPIATGLALLIGWAAWSERGLIGAPDAPVFWADVAVSGVLATIGVWAWSSRIPGRLVQATAFVIAAASATTALISDAYSTSSPDTMDLLVIMLGSSLVFLSVSAMAAILAYVWIGWSLLQGEWIPRFGDPGEFILMIATVISAAAFWARYTTMCRLIEAETREAQGRAKAERLAEELGRFAAVVAHDLQNPVSAIRLKASVLGTGLGEKDSRLSRLAEDIDRIAHGMGTMIRDLLDYAKADKAQGSRKTVEWRPLFTEIEAIFADKIEESGGSLDVADMPSIRADTTQMRQLFMNLIGNAVHYRKKAQPIQISVHGVALDDGFMVTVADEGTGFEEELASQIFMPYERGASDRPGHGLGLATCRRIVENLGGTINAASQPGGGSVFTIWLPQEAPGLDPDGGPDRAAEHEGAGKDRPPRPAGGESSARREASADVETEPRPGSDERRPPGDRDDETAVASRH